MTPGRRRDGRREHFTGVEALVLAGGKGLRLRQSHDPALRDVPKPLVRVTLGGRPDTMLGQTLWSLQAIGQASVGLRIGDDDAARPDELAIRVHAEQLACSLGLSLRVSREATPLGTAGAVALALKGSRAATIVVVPVDLVFPYHQLQRCIAIHWMHQSMLTWLVTTLPGELAQNAGKLLLDASRKRVVRVMEGTPPRRDVSSRGLVAATSSGVMLGDRCFLDVHLEAFAEARDAPGPADLDRDFAPWLLDSGVAVHALDLLEPVIDLGTPERIAPFLVA